MEKPLQSAGEKPELANNVLIPGLPNEVALGIVVRLPNVVQARLRLVCRTWNNTMEPATMCSIRKMLHISEVWLVALSTPQPGSLNEDPNFLFTVEDPLLCRIRKVYPPPQFQFHRPGDYLELKFFGIIGHEVLMAVKPRPGASVRALELQGLYSFDGARMKWKDAKYSSFPTTTLHVCVADMDGGYLYVGAKYGWELSVLAMERLHLKTKMWEVLPYPHVKRINFAAVVLQSLFCMIGGVDAQDSVCNSGELWDPASREWTLVPELWPFEVFESCSPMFRVAVVKDRLYALRTCTPKAELMYYETSSKVWISLGHIPHSHIVSSLFGVDQELWVLDEEHRTILVTKPSLSQPLSWRALPDSLKSDNFTSYVGAMLV